MKGLTLLFCFVLLFGFAAAYDESRSAFKSVYCDCYDGMTVSDTDVIGHRLICSYNADGGDINDRHIVTGAGMIDKEGTLDRKKEDYKKLYDAADASEHYNADYVSEPERTIYMAEGIEDKVFRGQLYREYRGYGIFIRTTDDVPWDLTGDFDIIEQCMMDSVDKAIAFDEGKDVVEKEEQSSISLKTEHPFPYIIEDSWFSSPGSLIGGEVRATVLNEDGKPEKGEMVVFYIEKDDALHGVIASQGYERFAGSTTTWREIENNINDVDLLSYVGHAVTDKNGFASINYLYGKRLNMQKLSANIVLGKGEVAGKIHAVVVDTQKKEVEMRSSVDLKFDHIAKIVKISGEGVPDSPPAGATQYVVSGPGQVRVKRTLVEPFTYDEVKAGHELMPGDIINADADTRLEIMWVNGDRVIAKLPRYISVAEKSIYSNANLVLLADAYSSGFPSTLGKGGDIAYGMAVEKGWSFLVDTIKSEIPGSGVLGNGYDFVVGISEKFKEYDAVDLSKFSIISRIRVKSQFLVDATEDEMRISVLEGNPDLKTWGGEVSLEEDESVVFSSNGEIGEVERIDKDDFEGWEIPDVRVLKSEEGNSNGFSFFWWVFWIAVIFVLYKKFAEKKIKKKK